jgi:hypothetical protein
VAQAAGQTPEARARQVRGSLRALGKAMHAYCDKHDNAFPLPVVQLTLEGGSKPQEKLPPMGLSWRVQLLPYLRQAALYREFKLDEPWDSPHNKKLIAKMPKVFASPRVPGTNDPAGHTHYQVFTAAYFYGPGPSPVFPHVHLAAWVPGQRPPRIAAIPDGTNYTVLIAEAARAVPWTKPEDLPYGEGRPIPALGHALPGKVFVCLANGKVHVLSKRAKASDWRALITANGGEVVDVSDLVPEKFAGPEPKTAVVSGKVTYQGKPLSSGWIIFHSQDGRESGTALGADGSYRAQGVSVGTTRLTVATDPNPPLPFLRGPRPVRLPLKYANPATSGLTVEVGEGNLVYDVALQP